MSEEIEIKHKITLNNIFWEYCKIVGFRDEKTPVIKHQFKYINAMEKLGRLFIKHHREFSDSDFSRIFRILAHIGIGFCENEDNNPKQREVIERFSEFKYQEIDE